MVAVLSSVSAKRQKVPHAAPVADPDTAPTDPDAAPPAPDAAPAAPPAATGTPCDPKQPDQPQCPPGNI